MAVLTSTSIHSSVNGPRISIKPGLPAHQFASAAGLLAGHFEGRVTAWEVWNEPNAWGFFDAVGHIWGSSFIYRSNFAWLLKEAYPAIKTASHGSAAVVSGAVLGTANLALRKPAFAEYRRSAQ